MVPTFIPSRRNSIYLLGEAPGEEEAKVGMPFVGSSGQELNRMCNQAGINFSECIRGNVFSEHPPGNNLEHFCVSLKEAKEAQHGYSYPPLLKSKYVHPKYLGELSRLHKEIESYRPNIIVALGNTPIWALLGYTGIGKVRGAITAAKAFGGVKVLPTYHPAYILRAWDERAVVVMDLMKAAKESKFPEVIYPKRTLWIQPTIEDLYTYWERFLKNAPYITFDIETSKYMISCIGFAPNKENAIVVPFFDKSKPDWNYWPDLKSERLAWDFVRMVMESNIPKIAQNPLFDIQYIWRQAKIIPRRVEHDTMLIHHALQPELPKSLGFMGATYTNEASWKGMRNHHETEKREE